MASILKNQIIKHLSKFTKNLSPDQINISTLKGEGELSNLELDENILMELLDLPTWMQLNKAICNKVSVKVQWTKLKSQPICLYLDEVVLEIETCAEPRPPNSPAHKSSYRSEGRYGFIDKVIDGMYVHINSVSVQFMSQMFNASLQLSRVKVQSLTPNWGPTTDLRQSRIRNEPNDEILLFKEVDWQTTRIEANARDDDSGLPSTPLRLIANQSKIRIVLKKKLSDCSIIASRVILLLDDILWVLTDTQLKAAILYGNSLRNMIEKSAEQSKKLAADKLQKQGHMGSGGAEQLVLQQKQQQQRQQSHSSETKFFQKFDVVTTSYHLITGRIDLHLCDDTQPDKAALKNRKHTIAEFLLDIEWAKETSPKHNSQIHGGAMQITFCKLSVDMYPFHPAGGERKQWYRYTDNQGSRNSWVQELFTAFRKEAAKARETCRILSPAPSPANTPLRSPVRGPPPQQRPPQPNSSTRGQSRSKVTKLLESCVVVRIEEFVIYRVSTADNRRSSPQKFFSSDKKALHLPSDMSVVHIEYTDYFFTEGIDYPVPHANLYVLINPVRLTVDYLTVLWANYFSLNLAQMVETHQTEIQQTFEHMDIKIEALMPRVVLAAEEKVDGQSDRPESLQIQFSKITASNTNSENQFTLTDLQALLQQYAECDIFNSSQFPCDQNKLTPIPKIFQSLASGRLNPYLTQYAQDLVNGRLPEGFSDADFGLDAIQMLLRTNTLKRDSRCDIWGIFIDQVWVEFLGVPTSRTRPVPFIESFPLTLWICGTSSVPDGVVSPSSTETGISRNVESKRTTESKTTTETRAGRKSKQLLKQYYSEDSDCSPKHEKSSNGCYSDCNENTNGCKDPQFCDNEKRSVNDGEVQYTSLKVADLSIVGKIGSKIRAQLSHPQYLFLMRLTESISNFQVQLNADIESFYSRSKNSSSNVKANSEAGSFCLPLVIPELEFAMLCPYIAELLPLTNPGDSLCSPMSSDGHEGFVETDSDLAVEIEGSQEDVLEAGEQMLTVTQSPNGSRIEMHDSLYPDPHLVHSQSDTTIVCHSQPQLGDSIQHNPPGIRFDSHSTNDVTMSSQTLSLNTIGQSTHYTASDSGLSSLGSSHTGHQRSRSNSKLTPTTVRKSFTSGVSNISNFMGKIKNKLDPDDLEDCDSLSQKTDLSDDDDFEFLSLDDNEAPAFHHGSMSETASSTDTDDISSMFAESTSASKAKETISAIVFRLTGTEVLVQSCGADMTVGIQTRAIDTEETGNIVYEDFYSKLSAPSGVLTRPAGYGKSQYPLKFKYLMGPEAELQAPRGEELGVMDVLLRGCGFKFRMSSILNMSSFIEEEKAVTPMPMHVKVDGLEVILLEDRPPMCSSPATQPLHLNIHNMLIQRHDDGIFHMVTGEGIPSGDALRSSILKGTQSSSVATKTDNTANNEQTLPNNVNENELDHSDLPAAAVNKIKSLERENLQLKLLLEKLDNHSQEQDKEIEELKQTNEVSKKEISKLTKMQDIKGNPANDLLELKQENERLAEESSGLMEKVMLMEDEMENVRSEKASLVSTLQLLQDELWESEQRRQRGNSRNSMDS